MKVKVTFRGKETIQEVDCNDFEKFENYFLGFAESLGEVVSVKRV